MCAYVCACVHMRVCVLFDYLVNKILIHACDLFTSGTDKKALLVLCPRIVKRKFFGLLSVQWS